MKKTLLFVIAVFCSTLMWAEGTANDTIIASSNGFINENVPTVKVNQSVWNMEVRTTTKYTRWGYLQLPLEKIVADASKIEFKVYLTGEKLATKTGDGSLNPTSYTSDDLDGKGLKLSLNLMNYTFDSNLTWDSRIIPDVTNETHIGDVEIDNSHKDTYLVWDVTDVVKARKAAGDNHIYLRLETKDATEMLRIRQVKVTTSETGSYYPRLIQTRTAEVGIIDTKADELAIYPTIVTTQITIADGIRAMIYNMQGKLLIDRTIDNNVIDVSDLDNGLYILKNDKGAIAKFIKK